MALNAYRLVVRRALTLRAMQIFVFENNALTRFLDDDAPSFIAVQKASQCLAIKHMGNLPPFGANYFGYNTLNDFWDSSQNIQNLEKCKLYDSEQYFLSKSPQEFSYTPRIYLAKDLNPASDSDEDENIF